MQTESWPVAIVGGGPVGLIAALEFARYGIRTVVLERHPTTTIHPKARNLNTRTMEITRRWGDDVHDGLTALNLPRTWTGQIVYSRSLAGEELGVMKTKGFGGPGPDISPEIPLLSSQDIFEPVLKQGVEATGLSEIRFDTKVDSVDRGAGPEDEGATLTVTESTTGRTYAIDCDYVVAADGARSGVRRQLGIELEGVRNLRHFVNVYFRADLSEWTASRPAMLFWVLREDLRGVFQPLDGKVRWLCQIPYDGTDETRAAYDEDRCRRWIREAVGSDSVDPEILSLEHWSLSSVTAERLTNNRVILAGDAAHQIPPIGGFGVNTAIQGVHNVIWKLALVRNGLADASLLQSYDEERRAVARYNGERSVENTKLVEQIAAAAIGGDGAMSPREAVAASTQYGNFIGMELGYCYESTAVVPDGSIAPTVDNPITEYVPDGRPGCRAPHFALHGGGEEISTLDLVTGPHFALLASADAPAWRQVAADCAEQTGLDIRCSLIGPGGDWEDSGDAFAKLMGVGPGGAVLVRPDGHVAFRQAEGAGDDESATALRAAFEQILHSKARPKAAR